MKDRPKMCFIDGCDKKTGTGTRGYCYSCYEKALRRGLPRLRIRQPGRICSIEGCERPYHARDLCHRHCDRLYRYGSPTYDPRSHYGEWCSVNGCGRKADTKGMCDAHYRRQLRRPNSGRANLWGERELKTA